MFIYILKMVQGAQSNFIPDLPDIFLTFVTKPS